MPSTSAIFFVALSTVSLSSAAKDQGKPINTQRSSLVIHVGKAGLLSAAAHEHWVDAPIASGTVDDASVTPSVRFVVDATKLTVTTDKSLSDKDLAEVQSDMQNRVLESSKYPDIVFQSTQVRSEGSAVWKVNGNLTLHGVTRPVIIGVRGEKDAYVGTASIKQTDFGIHPIQVGGGVVKVKNELEIRFKIYVTSRAEKSSFQ
jgi:polyisoprenoid-binding protein YceI